MPSLPMYADIGGAHAGGVGTGAVHGYPALGGGSISCGLLPHLLVEGSTGGTELPDLLVHVLYSFHALQLS